jgi:predicted nucleotidyltransferase
MARIRLAADFRDFLSLCLRHEVRFLVIGGYAVVHYARPRYTGDLDLWIEATAENEARVIAVLRDFGFSSNQLEEGMIADQRQIIRMGFEPMRLELFTHFPGVDFVDCYPRRSTVRIGTLDVPFIGLEDLKAAKRASGRTKDLLDLEELP